MAEARESTLRQDLNHPESRKRALYAAFASKDARFDGQAFVGVSSTGMYCRPVCHVHMPKYENCTFYETAAEAEAAGYRPCLVRRQFDVDCDPQAVHEGIASLDDAVPGAAVLGTRVPGCFDPFETAVRAVLGQQVTVVAANRLAARIVERYGKPMDTGIPGLTHAFPTAAEVAALEPIEDALGVLGVIKTRSRTIAEIARLLEAGDLRFDAGAVVAEQMERLLAVKGIGPWSAYCLAMRVLSHPDAFMETDAGVKHALPHLEPKERLELAEQWRPWRSYAVLCLWNSLAE